MNKTFDVNPRKSLYDWIILYLSNLFFSTCLVIAIALITFSLILVECEVTGPSMQPTLNRMSGDKHDLVFVNRLDRDFSYGDIVVIETSTEPIIKRIIGLEYDVIDIVCVDGIYKLERNGEILDEDYILINNSVLTPTYSQNGMNAMSDRWIKLRDERQDLFNSDGKLVVGKNEVFALGDNRKVSLDSSVYGTFSQAQITGRVESIRYYGESEFDYYFNYIMYGGFIHTILNIF